MVSSTRRLLAGIGVAHGLPLGVAFGWFGLYMLSGAPVKYSSHPLDGLVPIVGVASLGICLTLLMIVWRLSRSFRRSAVQRWNARSGLGEKARPRERGSAAG